MGNRTRAKVVKNKMAPPFKQAEFDIVYGKGISREGSIIDMGVDTGIVRKSGSWFTYGDDQLGQGKENVRQFLADNPALAGEIEQKILVALGIDYNIFLMTRVREEAIEHGTREGILRGLTITAGVITSAGMVLAATFASLAVIPILFLAQLAFIVAFGVLLDTFVVRSLLVPALSYDIGRAIWWPSRLVRKADDAPLPVRDDQDAPGGTDGAK